MTRAVVWPLAAAVVALQIPYPLVHGHVRNVLTVTTVVVFALAAVAHATSSGGVRTGAALAAVAGLGGFVAEAAGVHTGVPFGRYRYTGGLGPELLDVPVVIPLAWMMMAWPAAQVARRISPARTWQVVAAAVALASWDVFLDPQMVAAGHWRWRHPSPHLPGVGDVPLTNYAGWLAVAVVLEAVLLAVTARPVDHGDRAGAAPMLALWSWTWLSSTLANLAFFHRPAVAGWGFAAMALVGIPLVHRMASR